MKVLRESGLAISRCAGRRAAYAGELARVRLKMEVYRTSLSALPFDGATSSAPSGGARGGARCQGRERGLLAPEGLGLDAVRCHVRGALDDDVASLNGAQGAALSFDGGR